MPRENTRSGLLREESDRYSVAMQSLPEAGESRVELMKAGPSIIFHRWGGEVRVAFGSALAAAATRVPLRNRIDYVGSMLEIHAYPLEGEPGMEDGGFEIEFLLKQKPAMNRLPLIVAGAADLDFLYQPRLTQEELDRGKFRPENVVGSYAIYHKRKRNHEVGHTNYAAGKILHLYRPKAVDANGVEEWANLSYVAGILTLSLPQAYIDSAVYPVVIDPTFGYTSIGASDDFFDNTDYFYSLNFGSPSGDATLNSMSVVAWVPSGTRNIRMALYSNSAGTPPAVGSYPVDLIAGSDTGALAVSITTKPSAPGDWTTGSDSGSLTGGAYYWLTENMETSIYLAYDSGVSYQNWYAFQLYSGFPPATAPTVANYNLNYSIYATYTLVAAGRVRVNPQGMLDTVPLSVLGGRGLVRG